MLLHDSRRAARTGTEGELVLLEAQDRSLWNAGQIAAGLELLDKALVYRRPGPYQIQAAISALHAQASTCADTDWPQIALLYEALTRIQPSPVIEINRAVAVGMANGPAAGLRLLNRVQGMDAYYPLHAARADLLRRAGEREAAAKAYQRAIALCQNPAERTFLARQLSAITR
jgi:RNA polymerase sigma-70 factor (ECF subfamily)